MRAVFLLNEQVPEKNCLELNMYVVTVYKHMSIQLNSRIKYCQWPEWN